MRKNPAQDLAAATGSCSFASQRVTILPTMAEGLELATHGEEQSFPLNSWQLTGRVIGWLAMELGIPVGGSLEDMRGMLEGKLVEDGHEPRTIQVVLMRLSEGGAI